MSRWSEPELPPELLRMRGRIDLDPLHGGSCLKATCSVRLTGEPMVAKDKVSSLQIQLNYQFLFDSLKLRIVKQSFLFVFYEIGNCKTKCLFYNVCQNSIQSFYSKPCGNEANHFIRQN